MEWNMSVVDVQSYGEGKVPEEFDADTRTLRETETL